MKPFLNSELIKQIETHESKITNPWEEQKTVSWNCTWLCQTPQSGQHKQKNEKKPDSDLKFTSHFHGKNDDKSW